MTINNDFPNPDVQTSLFAMQEALNAQGSEIQRLCIKVESLQAELERTKQQADAMAGELSDLKASRTTIADLKERIGDLEWKVMQPKLRDDDALASTNGVAPIPSNGNGHVNRIGELSPVF